MPQRSVMTAEAVEQFLIREFPQIRGLYAIEDIGPMSARLRCFVGDGNLRPGGTIAGPTMMALADVALYVAVLASTGPVGLTVTTNLAINFLRKPARRDLLGECHLLKLGRTLAVGEVAIRSDGAAELVAHATGTYSIPLKR